MLATVYRYLRKFEFSLYISVIRGRSQEFDTDVCRRNTDFLYWSLAGTIDLGCSVITKISGYTTPYLRKLLIKSSKLSGSIKQHGITVGGRSSMDDSIICSQCLKRAARAFFSLRLEGPIIKKVCSVMIRHPSTDQIAYLIILVTRFKMNLYNNT